MIHSFKSDSPTSLSGEQHGDTERHHKYKPKVLLEKVLSKLNTTIYVNHFIGIYAIKVNSCPEKERDKEEVK